ncbi:hypothetical protein JCM19039_1231 [Geomicrobium sp. JCM 19039]|nr:hypothetical protein JCM19039_1231 [Geomicrobium sp. JCM 19039]
MRKKGDLLYFSNVPATGGEDMGDMTLLLVFCLVPVVLSFVLGGYWLKHERFPWEKK